MIWKDRKYINPRKRVFKNMDTNEILNFEIQDDLDNIEEESTTPLNAHNLNMAQQELLDDMSKTYTGTSITANTVEGYGRINKIWGHTIEEGTGEKSPNNPYTLRCVGDLINVSSTQLESGGIDSSDGSDYSNAQRLRSVGYVVLEAGNYNLIFDSTKQTNIGVHNYDLENNYIGDVTNSGTSDKYNFTIVKKSKIRFVFAFIDNTNILPSNISNIQIQKNIEIISQNGDQQSSNVVVTKPLCCLKDGDNVVAQDWIDYTRGVVHRECGYEILDENTNIKYMDTSNNTARFMVMLDNVKSITAFKCNKLKAIKQSEVGDEECVIIRDLSSDNIINVKIKRNRLSEVSSTGIKNYLSSNPITIIYQLATPTTEPINCSNKIVQYATQTTVSNRDGAEIEVSLTNNEAISGVNGELGRIQEKTLKTSFNFRNYISSGIDVNDSSIFKANNIITLMLNISKSEGFEANTSYTIGTLPASIKPSQTIVAPCVFHTSGQAIEAGYIVINTNGEVKITTSTKKYACMCNLTYSID